MILSAQQRAQKLWHSSTAKVVAALAGSNIAAAVLGAVGALIQGRFVAPQDLGHFRQFSIITGYLFFLHLGVFHALERAYPYHIGRGEKEKALAMVEVGRTWIILVCVPLATIFFVLSCYSFAQGNWKGALGWLAQVIFVVTTLYGGYLGAVYRSGKDFQKLANAQMWGIPASAVVLPVFWLQPYIALFLRSISGVLTTMVQLHRNCPVKASWRFSWQGWAELVKQGIPRFSASYMATTGLDTVTATLVVRELGQMSLGYWSFAITLITLAQQIPQALTAIYMPRLVELYGKTGRVSECITLCKKPVAYGLLLLVFIVSGGMVATIFFLPVILPKYAATSGLVCLMLTTLPLKMLEAFAGIFSAMDWMLFLNVRALLSAALQVGISIFGIYWGWGLLGIGAGVLAANVLRALLLLGALVYAFRLEKRTLLPAVG